MRVTSARSSRRKIIGILAVLAIAIAVAMTVQTSFSQDARTGQPQPEEAVFEDTERWLGGGRGSSIWSRKRADCVNCFDYDVDPDEKQQRAILKSMSDNVEGAKAMCARLAKVTSMRFFGCD
jgi:hypothetical protein